MGHCYARGSSFSRILHAMTAPHLTFYLGLCFATVLGGCGADDEQLGLDYPIAPLEPQTATQERSASVAGQATFEGRIETRDIVLDGTAHTVAVLVTKTEELELWLDPDDDFDPDLVVRVWGEEVEDGVLEVERWEIVAPSVAAHGRLRAAVEPGAFE